MQQVPDIVEILLPDRTVEAKLRHQFGMAFRADAALTGHQQDRIAGQNTDESEGNDRDADEGRHQIDKFVQYEAEHTKTPTGCRGSPYTRPLVLSDFTRKYRRLRSGSRRAGSA